MDSSQLNLEHIKDPIVRHLIYNNLEYWHNTQWEKRDIMHFFNKYKKEKALVLVEIKEGEIYYNGNGNRLAAVNTLLKNIIKKYNLTVSFLISLRDEIYHRSIKTFDFRKSPSDIPESHPFKWGVSETSQDVCRIEESSHFDLNIPIFTFNKMSDMEGSIVFPHPNIINGGFNKIDDNMDFKEKTDVPVCRFSNIRADLNIPSRIKLVEMSYKNPTLLDCKGANKGNHVGHGKYVLHKVFLKVYRRRNLIDKNLTDKQLDEMMEYYKVTNYISKYEIIKYKYLICTDSWYNVSDYALVNSVLFRYKLDKCKYYEDFILTDHKDFIIFDENEFFRKIKEIKDMPESELIQDINNRKQKVRNYLDFPNLIDHYGQLLMEYSKIQQKNEK